MDDVDILRELLKSVYLTSRQRDALRRVLSMVSRRIQPPLARKVIDGGTPMEPAIAPLLGPGDEP